MKLSDDDLVLYADNRLSEARKQRLLEAARHDADLAEALAALDASRLPYKAAFDNQAQPPMPGALREDLQNLIKVAGSDRVSGIDATRKPARFLPLLQGWPIHLLQAACLLLCIGVGFLIGINRDEITSNTVADSSMESASGDYLAQGDKQRAWVARVVDYQTLYVANTVKHIEADLPATLSKLDKLAESAGIRTAVPDLTEAGYHFARAQELGYNGETLVQLVYAKEGHTPLALCFMPAGGDRDEHLQIAERHGLGTASWIDGDQRFVIVADESAEILRALYVTASGMFVSG